MKIHKLNNGATIITTSAHAFKFSDGSISEPQDVDVVNKFTLARTESKVDEIKGMTVNQVSMTLSEDQLKSLQELCVSADIVLIPFPVLTSLREQGIRSQFKNALAFNATKDTQRAAPGDKIVDLNNWSY